MATKARNREAGKDDYLDLVMAFPLKAIHDDAHLTRAAKVIDELTTIPEERLTQGQADYLEALSELVHSYESTRHPADISDVDGIDVLALLLEENDMSASDLGRLLGNRSLGSKILRRERGLSKTHIAILAERFKVSPSLFLAGK